MNAPHNIHSIHSGNFATDPPGDPATASEERDDDEDSSPAAPSFQQQPLAQPSQPQHTRSRSVTFFDFEILATEENFDAGKDDVASQQLPLRSTTAATAAEPSRQVRRSRKPRRADSCFAALPPLSTSTAAKLDAQLAIPLYSEGRVFSFDSTRPASAPTASPPGLVRRSSSRLQLDTLEDQRRVSNASLLPPYTPTSSSSLPMPSSNFSDSISNVKKQRQLVIFRTIFRELRQSLCGVPGWTLLVFFCGVIVFYILVQTLFGTTYIESDGQLHEVASATHARLLQSHAYSHYDCFVWKEAAAAATNTISQWRAAIGEFLCHNIPAQPLQRLVSGVMFNATCLVKVRPMPDYCDDLEVHWFFSPPIDSSPRHYGVGWIEYAAQILLVALFVFSVLPCVALTLYRVCSSVFEALAESGMLDYDVYWESFASGDIEMGREPRK